MSYAIYLRKSREDREAEARGEGETLARHRAALHELAGRLSLPIGAVYEEIVSGETISARPKMQRLLEEVEAGRWEGILVMEVERLARGNGIDQGLVSQAFSVSGTKIITPYKTYDPSNEMDEDYFEFGLFMSRREYQTIKRRLTAGRIASVKEGKYLGGVDPYGYRRVRLKNEKGWSLEIIPEQAEVIRKIYRWYLEGAGTRVIAGRLIAAGIKTQKGLDWTGHGVLVLLRKPIYCGYVTWGQRQDEKRVVNGRVVHSRRETKEYLKIRGRHEPIISEEDWNAVQARLDATPGIPIPGKLTMRNPYQGIVYCAACGSKMQLSITTRGKPIPEYSLVCRRQGCHTVGSRMYMVDDAVLKALKSWLSSYRTEIKPLQDHLTEPLEALGIERDQIHREITKTADQLRRAMELVEQQIYTLEQFVERRAELNARKDFLSKQLRAIDDKIENIQAAIDMRESIIPRLEHVIEAFPKADSAEQQHQLLKAVVDRIEYKRTLEPGQKRTQAEIMLTISPHIPKRGRYDIH